ncbi:RidA family protein [Pseudoxanthomonas sp. 22568]|uniref:RidA family protein n=1 Tax=Pseudoxanthomonas sp. 22568 TaxID=3453945 RepID=UPI003F82E546
MTPFRLRLAALLLAGHGLPVFAGTPDGALLHPVNPPGATIPNVSQAMRVDGGKLLLLSGHVPFRADGSLVEGPLEDQLEQVMRNLDATLRAAGSDFSHVARLTLYIRDFDPAQLPAIRKVRDRWIDPKRPPASALVGVQALFQPGVRIEVDAIAVIPESDGGAPRAP